MNFWGARVPPTQKFIPQKDQKRRDKTTVGAERASLTEEVICVCGRVTGSGAPGALLPAVDLWKRKGKREKRERERERERNAVGVLPLLRLYGHPDEEEACQLL